MSVTELDAIAVGVLDTAQVGTLQVLAGFPEKNSILAGHRRDLIDLVPRFDGKAEMSFVGVGERTGSAPAHELEYERADTARLGQVDGAFSISAAVLDDRHPAVTTVKVDAVFEVLDVQADMGELRLHIVARRSLRQSIK